jgi:hypothetical protein
MQKESLEERLRKHPALRARLEALLDMVEDESGQFERADDAEEFLISQLRSLGQEVLQEWPKTNNNRSKSTGTTDQA